MKMCNGDNDIHSPAICLGYCRHWPQALVHTTSPHGGGGGGQWRGGVRRQSRFNGKVVMCL